MEIKVGDRIRIIKIDDKNGKDTQASRLNGKEGIVHHIDSLGQLHGTWGGLALQTDRDVIENLTRQ